MPDGLLTSLGLSPEQKLARRDGIGGSDATKIMYGSPEDVYRLWEQKTGQREPEDLTSVLPVMMGVYTEPFNIAWFAKTTGRAVSRQGESVAHPVDNWRRVTLDGMTTSDDGSPAVLQCKHVNAFSDMDKVVQDYMAQLHHEMDVTRVERAVLSVFRGTLEYHYFDVEYDWAYAAALRDREMAFWEAVQTRTPPNGWVPAETVPVDKAIKLRAEDMPFANMWANLAADYLDQREAVEVFEKAKKEIKALIPPGAYEVRGYGIFARRAKNGAVSIKVDGDAE